MRFNLKSLSRKKLTIPKEFVATRDLKLLNVLKADNTKR